MGGVLALLLGPAQAEKLFLTIAVCDIPEHPRHVVSVHSPCSALSSPSKHCFGFIFALYLSSWTSS